MQDIFVSHKGKHCASLEQVRVVGDPVLEVLSEGLELRLLHEVLVGGLLNAEDLAHGSRRHRVVEVCVLIVPLDAGVVLT